jgi:hypothetical protein
VDEKIHVFTLRIWREPREVRSAKPKWRGVIIHLATGEKKYFESLDEILTFIVPFIEDMGVRADQVNEPAKWFDQWLTSLRKKLK